MEKEVKVAAFEGGSLRVLAADGSGREAVLALPMSRLIVKMVKVPVEQDAAAAALPILQAMSPFPDEALTVSCERVAEIDGWGIYLAAALPESAADDIAEALDAAKLNVTRIDALELGVLRGSWNEIAPPDAPSSRRLVMLECLEGVTLFVLDGDRPSAIRALTDTTDLRREVTLCLLEAERFGGVGVVREIVWMPMAESRLDVSELEVFAPIRKIAFVEPDLALRHIADRSVETDALDVSPESWREVLQETRFKRKLIRGLSVAGGIWALIMGVLFGVPVVYGFMTDYQKGLSREHRRQYEAVKAMKGKVDLVRKYSDHSRGALEIMKALSDRLPEGVELSSWNFKREDGVRISGEADSASDVYKFKDLMIELGGDDRVFGAVNLIGPSAGRGGKQKFDLDCRYQGEDAE